MIYGIVGLESELFTIYPLSVLNHNSIKPNYLCYTLSVYILYPFCDIVGLDRRFISVASPFCSYPLSGFFFTITFMIFPPFIFKEDTSSLLLRFADVSSLRSWLTGAFYTSTLFLNWNSSENRTNTDTERERSQSEWWLVEYWQMEGQAKGLIFMSTGSRPIWPLHVLLELLVVLFLVMISVFQVCFPSSSFNWCVFLYDLMTKVLNKGL